MNCKNRQISKILLVMVLFITNFAIAQGPDSLYKVPNNPLITQLIELPELNASFILSQEMKIIPLQHTILAPNAQQILKHGADFYVIINQTGFVYKLNNYDSTTCEFKRIDHTVNLNYNIDAKNFVYQNQLYSYGGYGFWKSNGHLRKFNFEDSEWDIIPLNDEIMLSSYVWYSEPEGRIYVPFQQIVNAGIKGSDNVKGVRLYDSYYLDLNQKKWVKLGQLENDLQKLFQDNSNVGFLNLKMGLLHLIHDEAYLFDFVHNKVYKSKNADLNQFLIRRAEFTNMFVHDNYIYSYSVGSKNFNKYPFKLSDFELLRTNIWGNEHQLYLTILIIIICIIVALAIIWLFNRSVKRKLEVAQLTILKTKSINQAFTSIEVSLIEILLKASLKNETVEIYQINHVLGIKDKNLGLQKKVRSDVINAINDKYEFITQSKEVLIGSRRKEYDKRFFEYFITSTEVKSIQRILENN
jgi:hypothetical protein